MPTVNRGHDESNLRGVGRACEVGIDLLVLGLIQRNESVEDIIASSGIIGASYFPVRRAVQGWIGPEILFNKSGTHTFKIREVIVHGAHRQLLLKPIDLVEEQDDAGLDEPSRVADTVEQCKSFLHAIHCFVLEQKLVVLGDGDQEEDGCDILKTMYPFLAFRSLPTNIEHSVRQVVDDEGGLGDTSCLDPGAQNILVVWHVIVGGNTVDRVEVTIRR